MRGARGRRIAVHEIRYAVKERCRCVGKDDRPPPKIADYDPRCREWRCVRCGLPTS